MPASRMLLIGPIIVALLSPYADVDLDLAKWPRGGFPPGSKEQTADFRALNRLLAVRLDVSKRIENRGHETVVHVRVENPTDKIAFFVQLAVTKSTQGKEVLPIFWGDNYFSLLPGQSREIAARFATEDLGGESPEVEVGGWNIQTPFTCTGLKLSKAKVAVGEPVHVEAMIRNTVLDGSRIELTVDEQTVDSTFAWARGDASRQATFELKLNKPGSHRIKIGDRTAAVLVE